MRMIRFTEFLFLISFTSIYAEKPPEVAWTKVYDSKGDDLAFGIAVDNKGYVYVTGASHNGKDYDYRTIKYDSLGNIEWNVIYHSEDDYGRDIVVDDSSYVYVTGFSGRGQKYNYLTIKYNPDGDTVWSRIYDSGNDDKAYGIAKDNRGCIYVTGGSYNGESFSIQTIKYNSMGDTVLKIPLYSSGRNDIALALRVDNAGYIYVTGASGTEPPHYDYRLIKYDSVGIIQWSRFYDSGERDWVNGIALDTAGFAYITGSSGREGACDFRTIKYDSSGNVVWNKPYDSGEDEAGMDVVVDEAGFVYVFGYSFNAVGDYTEDYRIIKYDQEGDTLWNVIYNSGDTDYASEICLDNKGYIYVTGASFNGENYDYLTVKYRQYLSIKERNLEEKRYRLLVHSLSREVFNIRYGLPIASMVNLQICDVTGRVISTLVNERKERGEYFVKWQGKSSGIYFIRFTSGKKSLTKKTILLE